MEAVVVLVETFLTMLLIKEHQAHPLTVSAAAAVVAAKEHFLYQASPDPLVAPVEMVERHKYFFM
jgi:hypothetical protein